MTNGQHYRKVIGVGGIGSGLFFALEGNHDLGRNESRAATLIDARDYCKLHIVTHYLATMLDGAVHILPVGCIGNDSIGLGLLDEMKAVGVDVSHVQVSTTAPTLLSVCYQYADGSGGNITANNSAATQLAIDDIDSIAGLLAESAEQCIALALPEVPLNLRDHFLKLATNSGALRVAAFTSAEIPEARRSGMLERVDLLFLNEDEASVLSDVVFDPFSANAFLNKCADTLRSIQPCIQIIVTAGKHGAFGFNNGEWTHSPAYELKVSSTAGAGDALIAGTLAGLISGATLVQRAEDHSIQSALGFGVLLGSFSTTSPHTIHPGATLKNVLAFAKDVGVLVALPLDEALFNQNGSEATD